MCLVHLGHASGAFRSCVWRIFENVFPAFWVTRLASKRTTAAHTQQNTEKNKVALKGFWEGPNGIQIKKKTCLF